MNLKMEYSLAFENAGVQGGVVADDRDKPEVVRPVQTHSCNVAVVGVDGRIPCLDDTDAIICMAKGIKVGVRTADCVPVIIYSPDIEAVAAVHAGWKGTLAGILTKTLEKMRAMGANLELAEVAFGPSICGKCYEVSQELAEKFKDAGYEDCLLSDRHVDLESVNVRRLLSAGIRPEKIHRKRNCTYETDWLPSWRRNQSDRRLLTWIGLTGSGPSPRLQHNTTK